jgi:hypothetical protein
MTLREILTRADQQPPKAWLYLPADTPWNLESDAEALISPEVPPDREDDPDAGTPDVAKKMSLMRALPITTVQEIVENALSQRSDATAEELFKAFIYYYDNDAFIDLGTVPGPNIR